MSTSTTYEFTRTTNVHTASHVFRKHVEGVEPFQDWDDARTYANVILAELGITPAVHLPLEQSAFTVWLNEELPTPYALSARFTEYGWAVNLTKIG